MDFFSPFVDICLCGRFFPFTILLNTIVAYRTHNFSTFRAAPKTVGPLAAPSSRPYHLNAALSLYHYFIMFAIQAYHAL